MTLKILKSPFVGRTNHARRSRLGPFQTPRSLQPSKGKQSNIKVCVRVRPLNNVEDAHGEARVIVRPLDETLLVFDPYEPAPETYYKGRVIRDVGVRRNKDLKLAFDQVFHSGCQNSEIFECTTKKMLDNLLDGINCSIFAYGATGAGKTFTMLGTYECPGVIPRTMNELYARIEAIKEDWTCQVEISYLEIYNESVRDLLNPQSGQLAVREDGGLALSIAGLSTHRPESADMLFRMLDEGNKNRTQHPTDANKESSRSHAIFQVILKQSPRTADISSDNLVSKMVLVDLAGSERATATKNCGDRMREGANINRSLLALGNCINALAEGKKGAHIPYRDSKLTRILKDSLGGNCHTLMIANVSPSSLSYDDTQNTLKYADRAKHIKADLRKNVIRVDQHIHQYGKIVQDLKTEIEELKNRYKNALTAKTELENKLKLAEQRPTVPVAWGSLIRDETILDEIKGKIAQYVSIQNQLLASQSQQKLFESKLDVRQTIQTHLNTLDYDPSRNEHDLARTSRAKNQFESKIRRIDRVIDELKFNLNDLSASIRSSVKKLNLDDHYTAWILNSILSETRSCQFNGVKKHCKALLMQNRERVTNSTRLINALCSLAKEQHLILSSYDRLTVSLKSKFEDIVTTLEAHKEISWSESDEASLLKENEHISTANMSKLDDFSFKIESPGAKLKGKNLEKRATSAQDEQNYSSDNNSDQENLVPTNQFDRNPSLNRTFDLSEASPNGMFNGGADARDDSSDTQSINKNKLSPSMLAFRQIENLAPSTNNNRKISPQQPDKKSNFLNLPPAQRKTPPGIGKMVSGNGGAPKSDEKMFKKPALPPPRPKIASTSQAALPPSILARTHSSASSFPRNSPTYGAWTARSGSATSNNKSVGIEVKSSMRNVQRSPSFSNLRLHPESTTTDFKLKKTVSTTTLWR